MFKKSKQTRTSVASQTQDGASREQNSNGLILFIYQGRRAMAPRRDCYKVSAQVLGPDLLSNDSPSTSLQSSPAEKSSLTYLQTTR